MHKCIVIYFVSMVIMALTVLLPGSANAASTQQLQEVYSLSKTVSGSPLRLHMRYIRHIGPAEAAMEFDQTHVDLCRRLGQSANDWTLSEEKDCGRRIVDLYIDGPRWAEYTTRWMKRYTDKHRCMHVVVKELSAEIFDGRYHYVVPANGKVRKTDFSAMQQRAVMNAQIAQQVLGGAAAQDPAFAKSLSGALNGELQRWSQLPQVVDALIEHRSLGTRRVLGQLCNLIQLDSRHMTLKQCEWADGKRMGLKERLVLWMDSVTHESPASNKAYTHSYGQAALFNPHWIPDEHVFEPAHALGKRP